MQRQAASSTDDNFRQDFQVQAAVFQKDASARRNEELGKVQRYIVQDIQSYARTKHFDIVFGSGVFFAKGGLMITPDIEAILASQPSALPASTLTARDGQYPVPPVPPPSPPAPGLSGWDIFAALLTGASQGYAQGEALRHSGRAGGASTQTYVAPAVASQGGGSSGQNGIVDPGILQCIQLGRDNNNGFYFQNNCNVKARISYVCRDAGTNQNEAMSETDPDPGTRGAAPCYLPRDNTDWAACPYQDGIFGTDGNPWRGYTPFVCKHFN